MKTNSKSNSAIWSVARTYWVHLLFIFFLVNYVIVRTLQLEFFASNCITRSQMQSDSRCLYSYNGNVYEKGSRSRPHHGHSCGSDVTTSMPSGHIRNMAKYLDPSLVGSICTDSPASTNTPIPTVASTHTPTPTQRPANTPTPTSRPANTPTPTQHAANTPTPTQRPANSPTPTTTHQSAVTPTPTRVVASGQSTPTPTKQIVQAVATKKVIVVTATPIKKTVVIVTPTSTPIIVQASNSDTESGNIGGFGTRNQLAQQTAPIQHESEPPLTPVEEPTKPVDPTAGDIGQKIIMWSEILVVVSFLLLIVTIVVGVYKRLRTHL